VADSQSQPGGGTLIGYARCSTATQDLTAQQDALRALGVKEERIYLDRGLTGRNRERAGLGKALAAVRDGDTLVVPKRDRLAAQTPERYGAAYTGTVTTCPLAALDGCRFQKAAAPMSEGECTATFDRRFGTPTLPLVAAITLSRSRSLVTAEATKQKRGVRPAEVDSGVLPREGASTAG